MITHLFYPTPHTFSTILFDFIENISYRSKCFSTVQLHKTLKLIIDEGGEGVMIRMPKSVYEPGRSTLLIKFKV